MRRTALVSLIPLSLVLAGCPKGDTPKYSYFSKLITEDTKVGTGPAVEKGDHVSLSYKGRRAFDDKEFDSNINNKANTLPNVFVVGDKSVIKGMDDGVVGMKPGGKRTIKIPYEQAYGKTGSKDIPPYTDIIFEIELLHVVKKADFDVFDYEDVKPGSGPDVKDGSKVTIHYTASYVNGRTFDDTRKRGQSVSFTVGKSEAISGVDRGVIGMKAGGVRKLTLPADTAWGRFGSNYVAPNQVLIIELELLSVGNG